MSEEKAAQPTSFPLPLEVDAKGAKRLVSDHMLQAAEAKGKSKSRHFAILNAGLVGAFAIETPLDISSAEKEENNRIRRERVGAALRQTKDSGVGIIALQEVPTHFILENGVQQLNILATAKELSDSKVAGEELSKFTKSISDDLPADKADQAQKHRLNLAGNLIWAQTNLSRDFPEWHLVGEPREKADAPRAILYDGAKYEEVGEALKLDSLSSDFLQGRVQVLQLKERGEEDAEAFILYNAYLPHENNFTNTQNHIRQILALEHNKNNGIGKKVYIMGDFNAPFFSKEARYCDNRMSVVLDYYRGPNGRRDYSSPDAILECDYDSVNNTWQVRPLSTKVLDFRTGQLIDKPDITLEDAQNRSDFDSFFPACFADDHLIQCHGIPEPKRAKNLIALVNLASSPVAIDAKQGTVPPVFLEKNIYNVPRIAIIASALPPEAQDLLERLKVRKIKQDPGGMENLNLPDRFVLRPDDPKDLLILRNFNALTSEYTRYSNAKLVGKIFAALAFAVFIAAATVFILSAFEFVLPVLILSVVAELFVLISATSWGGGAYLTNRLFAELDSLESQLREKTLPAPTQEKEAGAKLESKKELKADAKIEEASARTAPAKDDEKPHFSEQPDNEIRRGAASYQGQQQKSAEAQLLPAWQRKLTGEELARRLEEAQRIHQIHVKEQEPRKPDSRPTKGQGIFDAAPNDEKQRDALLEKLKDNEILDKDEIPDIKDMLKVVQKAFADKAPSIEYRSDLYELYYQSLSKDDQEFCCKLVENPNMSKNDLLSSEEYPRPVIGYKNENDQYYFKSGEFRQFLVENMKKQAPELD